MIVKLAPAASVCEPKFHVTCWRFSPAYGAAVAGAVNVGVTAVMPLKLLEPVTKLNRVAALFDPPAPSSEGRKSSTTIELAAAGPVFCTVIVYVTVPPGTVDPGVTVLETLRSAEFCTAETTDDETPGAGNWLLVRFAVLTTLSPLPVSVSTSYSIAPP